jgi:WD40 repeat protein
MPRCRFVCSDSSVSLGILLFVVLIGRSSAQTPDPFAPGAAATASADAAWGRDGLDVALTGNDKVFFGPPSCPIVVAGNRVYEIATGRQVCELQGELPPNLVGAIGESGKYVAMVPSAASDNHSLLAWDAKTGEQIMNFVQAENCVYTYFAISRDKYILCCGINKKDVEVWDIEKQLLVKTILMPGVVTGSGKMAFSPDGTHFVSVNGDIPAVFSTATGKGVVELIMSKDGTSVRRGLPSPAKNAEAFRAALSARGDARSTTAWIQAINFSPTGLELAAMTTHPNPRLLVWNNRGKLLEEIAIPDSAGRATSGHSLLWLPDGAGWIVNGVLVDRKSKRPVLRIQYTFGSDFAVQVLSRDKLMGQFSPSEPRLKIFTIPWQKIDASVAALNDKAPAILAPYVPVSIRVRVGRARGDAMQLGKMAYEGLEKRLARDGLTVKPDQPTTFFVTISEQAGEQLAIHERRSRFDFFGSPTGRTATEAKGEASVEIHAAGEEGPLYREILRAGNSRSFDNEITDDTVRQSMLDQMSQQLNRLDIPYFIPKSEDLLALPAVVE